MTLQEWANAALAHQFGNYIDVDGYYQGQCWDLAAHYAREVVGCPSLPTGSGGAEGVYRLFQNPIPQYFEKVANNPNDPNQLPPAGALIVYGPVAGNPYGHIEIVMGANTAGVDVVYQDGFNPTQGPLRKFRKWGTLPCMGWLVPKTQAKPALQGSQRIVADGGVNRRSDPSTNNAPVETFAKGDVLDFGGWLYGQVIDNNNVWFKGRYSDTYFWSGAFTDTGAHDLTDLNPAKPTVTPLAPTQRVVGDGGLNVRSEPTTLGQIIKVLPQGTVIDCQGFKNGATVSGNAVWFRTVDGWVWSGGLTDASTHDLTDLNTPTPTTPVDVFPAPTTDPLVTTVLNKKHPISPLTYSPSDLVTVGSQKLRSEAAAAYTLMFDKANTAGIALTPVSGFRSYDAQKTLFDNYVKQDGKEKAETYSARPGYSEHQTGLTMDIGLVDDSFKDSSASKWLLENAYKYGWILRYPSDKVAVTGYMYEPWHWRYVGVTVAADMKAKNITTLEEYYGVQGGDYADNEPTKPTEPTTPTEPTKPTEPVPGDLDAYVTSIIRTAVPYLVGLVAAFATTHKLILPAGTLELLTALLTFLFGTGWYIVWRWLETKFPQLGWFLGKASQPIYPKEEK